MDISDDSAKEVVENFEKARKETIYPYAEKMGNCQVICLAGDHMIYEQKPAECGDIIKGFVEGLDE